MLSPRANGDLKQRVGVNAADEIEKIALTPIFDRNNKAVHTGNEEDMVAGQVVLVVRTVTPGKFHANLPPRPKPWQVAIVVDRRGADVAKTGAVVVRSKAGIPVDGMPEGRSVSESGRYLFDGTEWCSW